MSFDYALETKLSTESPLLHEIFTNNVMSCQNILHKYQSIFPTYTDHTSLHSLEVIAFCNELVGGNIERLNCDEIFVLLMAAYLHDSGMGLSQSDYESFSAQLPAVSAYREKHPNAPIDEIIRLFHHEFSGKFIEKYSMIFDFPSKEHLFATVQISRGHRKMNLYDEKEYPAELVLENKNVIHLPYLAALLRVTDELDIAEDRNIGFMYHITDIKNEVSLMEFQKHLAIKTVVCGENAIRATVDFSNENIRSGLLDVFKKLNETLSDCVKVVAQRTPFEILQKRVEAFDQLTEKAVYIGG